MLALGLNGFGIYASIKRYNSISLESPSVNTGKVTEGVEGGNKVAEKVEGVSGSKTGTVWDNITSTADNMPATEIPATFKIELNGNINYVNPETGTNTL